ncbi:MAG TPA: glucoamylase family protein [Chloroflexota bacterium]|nr:glucoamylase family protein [Chloroflexota bacterium]
MDKLSLLHHELKGSVDFFRQFTNLDARSKGFGLTVDSTKDIQVASIASVGFALTAWVIAAERGYLSHDQAMDITRKTLHTLWHHVSHHRGFFAHFLHMESGERVGKCEYSTIDTALCLNGVITAAAYFQDDEIEQLARRLLERVDWHFLIFEKDGKTLFRMAYNPDKGGDYVTGDPGFIYQWDMAAEQKMMYLQAAAQIEPSVARRLYQGFSRDLGEYNGQKIIINPGGNLFAYQFSEAWLDTARYLDPDGVDWFHNTRLATLANRQFCLEHAAHFKTYHANSWGVSAGDSPWGYDVSGSTPSLEEPEPNGTVSIYGALSSLPFTPEFTLDMMQYLYHQHPQTWGLYGFFDSYNLAVSPPWYSHSLYGIDKGCSMIMIENYLSRLIWETYTNSPTIQKSVGRFRVHGTKGNQK